MNWKKNHQQRQEKAQPLQRDKSITKRHLYNQGILFRYARTFFVWILSKLAFGVALLALSFLFFLVQSRVNAQETKTDMVPSLNNTFTLIELRLPEQNRSFPLMSLIRGKEQIQTTTLQQFLGTSLPDTQIVFYANEEMYSTTTDAQGSWLIEIPGCQPGLVRLTGIGIRDDVVTQENNFGQYTCGEQQGGVLPPIDSTKDDTKGITKITAPTIATLALLNTGLVLPLSGLLPYLAFFFSEPFSILFRKRREGWGVVYNSFTKQPVDLAIVRLYDATTKQLLQTQVTDTHGRYNFLVEPGKYYIVVQKQDFTFPATSLKERQEDAKYSRLYYGDTFRIKKRGARLINFNVPIDIDRENKTNRSLLIGYIFYQGQRTIALLGPFFAFITLLIAPSIWFFSLLVLHILLYIIFRRFTYTPTIKTFGSIRDKTSGKPIKNAIVRLFGTQYNQLLENRLTNNKGQYNFLVGANTYILTVEKKKYRQYRSTAISIGKKKEGILAEDILLERL